MFFRPQRGRRGPHILLIRDSEEPIRLDEARLVAWAMSLVRRLAGRQADPAEEVKPAGETATDAVALGEARRKPYDWSLDAESDLAGAGDVEADGEVEEYSGGRVARRRP